MTPNELRIKSLVLVDVGPFSRLDIQFNPKAGINLICGGNGIGKTTILESIVAGFSQGRNHRIKRRQPANSGMINIDYLYNREDRSIRLDVKTFDPEKGDFSHNQHGLSENIINVRASRDFSYLKQTNISRDPDFDQKSFGQKFAQDANSSEIKSWLTNRYLLQHHADKSSWTPQMRDNLKTAVSFFSLLDDNFKLEEVDVRTFDILVSTPSGIIPFELLSSGFRSAYALLLGILKEIEFRQLEVSAHDFSGVILVDEIDLHLHPTWQQSIGLILKNAFPNAQVIATTHSPHVIQTAQAEEVISLSLEADGSVVPRSIMSTQYGYIGWTIEEILEDIMGVEDTRTPAFREAMLNFDAALDTGDSESLLASLSVLKNMLHPDNPLQKILDIQSAPYIGARVDGEAGR